jgi:prepilin-type N-terminal cleavage/methylation domain-containing protein/prepilin-type processing-associated H-X9-DG protein
MRRAFTLVELLVVVAIVALLIGLLLPALGKARQAARQVKCMTNMRTLQQGQLMYADAYRGALADVGLPHGGIGDPAKSFIFTLSEYFGSLPRAYDPASPDDDYYTPQVLRSPGDNSRWWLSREGGSQEQGTGVWRRTSYAMNNFLSANYPADEDLSTGEFRLWNRLERISLPASTVQFLMVTQASNAPSGPGFAVSDHPHAESWGNAMQAPARASAHVQTDRWGGPAKSPASRANYSFLDGHVTLLAFAAVYTDPASNLLNPRLATGR